jgi:hypothetical protein
MLVQSCDRDPSKPSAMCSSGSRSLAGPGRPQRRVDRVGHADHDQVEEEAERIRPGRAHAGVAGVLQHPLDVDPPGVAVDVAELVEAVLVVVGQRRPRAAAGSPPRRRGASPPGCAARSLFCDGSKAFVVSSQRPPMPPMFRFIVVASSTPPLASMNRCVSSKIANVIRAPSRDLPARRAGLDLPARGRLMSCTPMSMPGSSRSGRAWPSRRRTATCCRSAPPTWPRSAPTASGAPGPSARRRRPSRRTGPGRTPQRGRWPPRTGPCPTSAAA